MKKIIPVIMLLIVSVAIITESIKYQSISNSEASAKKEDPIVLTILAGQSTSDAGIEDMIDGVLAEKFPLVQLEWECVDWGEEFDSQMQARFASGDVPDIMVGKAQDVYSYAGRGNLAPVSTACIDKIDLQALPSVTVDNIVYGLPYNAFYQGVIYRRDIFDKYDLTPPKTLEELDQIIAVLNANRVTPFAAHFQESWQVGNMTMQFFMNDIFREDPDWGESFRQGTVGFVGNTAVEKCLLQNKYICSESWTDALIIDQYESDRRFLAGEAAMYLTGTWSMQSINQDNSGNKYGIFPYPNQTGDAELIRETNITFMKSSTSRYGDLIDQIFLELVTNETLINEVLDFTQTYSVIKDIEPKYPNCIQDDIDQYGKNNQVVEVTSGNNQLIWTFQNDLAAQQQAWRCRERYNWKMCCFMQISTGSKAVIEKFAKCL